MEVIHLEVKRSSEYGAQRARQRALTVEIVRKYPTAEVSEEEHIEQVDGGGWRAIPVIVVRFATGEEMTFFAEKPAHQPARGERGTPAS